MTTPTRHTRFAAWSWSGPGSPLDCGEFGKSNPIDELQDGLEELFEGASELVDEQFDLDLIHSSSGDAVRVTGRRDADGWSGVAVSQRRDDKSDRPNQRRREDERLRKIAKTLPVGIYVQHPDSSPDYANDYLLELFEVASVEEISWADHIHKNDLLRVQSRFQAWLSGRDTGVNHFRFITKQKEIRYLQTKLTRIEVAGDVRFVSAVLDQTEGTFQRQLALERQRQLDWSERISRTGSWKSDMQDNIVWSPGLYTLVGRNEESFDVNARSFMELIHPDYRAETNDLIERLIEDGTSWDYELALQPQPDKLIWVRSVGELVRDADGAPREIRGVLQDITPMRELEMRVRRAEKMQALGELAGGVAHDFNNLLTSILGNAQLLRQTVDEEFFEDCDEIIDTARRCAELTNQLLAFSRRRPLESDSVEIGRAIKDVLSLLKHVIDRNIEVVFDPGKRPIWARGDHTLIENAILNVALNSIQAMPDGGELVIQVSATKLEACDWEDEFEVVEGPAVKIVVHDTGTGIKDEDLRRVLEPFFTTRRDEGGTGLGLATVYGTVRNHGGALAVSSQPGKGTSVTILLPEAEPPVVRSDSTFENDAKNLEGLEVLLVDDEPTVRKVLRRYLEHLGCVVSTASGNREARQLIQTRCDAGLSFGAGVIDLSMKDGPGTETAELMRKTWPTSQLLIISGYDVETALKQDSGYRVLQKPFTIEALSAAIAPAEPGK